MSVMGLQGARDRGYERVRVNVVKLLPHPGLSGMCRMCRMVGPEPGWEREEEKVRVNVVIPAM